MKDTHPQVFFLNLYEFLLQEKKKQIKKMNTPKKKTHRNLHFHPLAHPDSGSAALASPPLLPDSNSLFSESDNFATSAKGSCGVDPGPVPLRILTLSVSSMGDWLYDVRKRLVLSRSLMFSMLAMQRRFTDLAVRGGGTDPNLMRPRKGSPGETGALDGSAPSSA